MDSEEKTMIDHTGVGVASAKKSLAFYKAALAPLGYQALMEGEGYAGFGVPPKPDFWIGEGRAQRPGGPCRIQRVVAQRGRCVLQGGHRGRRSRQRPARPAAAIPSELLRRVRAGSGRPQHRGRLPCTCLKGTDKTHRSGCAPAPCAC
jgi:catechol 2,3-dioxygenase-like lactoylglutathione lyase family enzyme